jgi:hypothetical protein
MSSDTTRARTVRRLGWLLGDGRWRVRTVDPEMTETTVDLGTPREWELVREARANQMLVERAYLLIVEMLPHATTRAHQNDLLDLQNLLTGKAKP